MMLLISLKLAVLFCLLAITTSSHLIKNNKNPLKDIEKTLRLTLDFIDIVRESDFNNNYEEMTSSNESMYKSDKLPPTKFRPSNCAEIQLRGFRKSGVYQVFPKGRQESSSFEVYCDLHTEGGGWTVFQRRDDFGEPREQFFRNWTDYKNGFGNLTKEFWLGNDLISLLTSQDRMNLRIEIEDFAGKARYATFTDFLVEGEATFYNMTFRYYSGTAGDSLKAHYGKTFATLDRDTAYGDAKKYSGGWWYLDSHDSNLNGLYQREAGIPNTKCISWYHFKNKYSCLKRSEMKLRPQYFVDKEFVVES